MNRPVLFYFILLSYYFQKNFKCGEKRQVICRGSLGVIFLLTQKRYYAVGTVVLYSYKAAIGNITMRSIIPLRSNTTRHRRI